MTGDIELFGGIGGFSGEGSLTVGVTLQAAGVVSDVAPATSSLGIPITKELKITASALGDDSGAYHWELTDSDGNVLADGLGDALTDVLLGFAVHLESPGETQ